MRVTRLAVGGLVMTGAVCAGVAGIAVPLGGLMPIPGRSDGSKIGWVETETVRGLSVGDNCAPVPFMGLVAVLGLAVVGSGWDDRMPVLSRLVGIGALSGLGAIPDRDPLRGRILVRFDLLASAGVPMAAGIP